MNISQKPFHRRVTAHALWIFLTLGLNAAQAQPLPAPSRLVYKCIEAGKTVYSDAPCPTASVIDVTPTKGMDTSTGASRKGQDVRTEERRDNIAQAIKPLTGMTNEQFATAIKRQPLTPAAKDECAQLDSEMPIQRNATELFSLRQRFRALRC